MRENCGEFGREIEELIKSGQIIDEKDILKEYELDVDKIKSIDDCKKILKFLCDLGIKPTPIGCTYEGFEDVKEYFK